MAKLTAIPSPSRTAQHCLPSVCSGRGCIATFHTYNTQYRPHQHTDKPLQITISPIQGPDSWRTEMRGQRRGPGIKNQSSNQEELKRRTRTRETSQDLPSLPQGQMLLWSTGQWRTYLDAPTSDGVKWTFSMALQQHCHPKRMSRAILAERGCPWTLLGLSHNLSIQSNSSRVT